MIDESSKPKIEALKQLAKMMAKLDLDRMSSKKAGPLEEEEVSVELVEEPELDEEELDLEMLPEDLEDEEEVVDPKEAMFKKMLAGRAKKI